MAKGYFNYCPNETWTPCVNLYETDQAYLVCVDLAGVDKEQIDVLVEDQTLRIHGTRAVPTPEDAPEQPERRLRVHLMEIDHGNFTRSVELPANVIKDGIAATHRNGMLWIELPKKL
jgi:HSP20 family protein